MWILVGGGEQLWDIFRHNGPFFPDEYKPHKIPIIINNKETILDPEIEEKITAYVKYLNTDYINNPRFTKNFFKEVKNYFNITLEEFNNIDFSLIQKHLDKEKEIRLSKTKEQKQAIKDKQTEIEKPYSILQLDGAEQKIGNFKIEPPGIFLGRGSHPKIGQWKKRIMPKDVTLNLDKDAPIPKPHLYPEHKWNKIVHQRESIWLATWKDEITGKNKYIFPSVESTFKSDSDKEKFDLARKLKSKIKTIRDKYFQDIKNDDITKKQLATALYFIDELALRVGGKKDVKEQADTVGVTSLRVEHINLLDNNKVKLDFLGKDSVKFCKLFQVDDTIYNNLQLFTQNKNKKEDLFDKISSSSLNNYLKSFLPKLSAKTWRTFKASQLFQKELNKIKLEDIKDFDDNEKINYLVSRFNYANTQVALLCNHQKNISKNFDDVISKLKHRLKDLKKKKAKSKNNKDKYNNKIQIVKSKLETKTKMKNVSLGTSKTNYIDPRIIIAFSKKFSLPLDKLFTKALLSRFTWAQDVDETFTF